jgi:phage baseplate assembly protein W
MAGISPKLPLRRDSVDGYDLIKNYVDMVRQNLKNLVLTNPGERMMDPSFGIGLKTYLFENNSPGLYGQIAAKVQRQVGQYMPFLNVDNIEFTDSEGTFSTVNGFTPREDPLNQEFNTVQVRMFITIKPLRRRTTLDMQF